MKMSEMSPFVTKRRKVSGESQAYVKEKCVCECVLSERERVCDCVLSERERVFKIRRVREREKKNFY